MLANPTLNKRMKTPLRLVVLLLLGLMAACRAPQAADSSNSNDVAAQPTNSIVSVPAIPSTNSTAETEPLDVNDISFLFPVPKTKEDADQLISLADADSDGPIMQPAIFNALIAKAKTMGVNGKIIEFPDPSFEDPHTWKVAGIRVNPTALGTNPKMLALAEIPGVRLIVQPVTVDGDTATVHDFAMHVVFNFIQKGTGTQIFGPNKAEFGPIIQDLRALKASMTVQTTCLPLQVHPGFSPDPKPLTDKLRAFIKTHLASSQLDGQQQAAISFMGIFNGFEPWIFFKVKVDVASATLTNLLVSGVYDSTNPECEMLSFSDPSSPGGLVEPEPQLPQTVTAVSTARLFPTVSTNNFDDPISSGTTNQMLQHFKIRDTMDIVANPQITSTLTTDCVSCHTESTRRNTMGNILSQPGTAFKPAVGISGVAQDVLPKDRWNLRNFGWGFNFFDGRTFTPTVSQRAANEAAESAGYINKNYPPTAQ